MKKFFSHPLFSGSFLMVAGSMGINGFNYVYHLIMGRVLGPEQYGVLASLFSLLYIISIIPLSTSFAIVKFISSANNDKERSTVYYGIRKLFWNIAIVASIITFALSPFIASFLHISEVFAVYCVSGVLFFSLIALVNQSSMQGVLKFYGVVGPNFISSFGKLAIGVAFLYMGWGVSGAVFAVVLGVGLAYLYSELLIKRIFVKNKGVFPLKKFFTFALPVLLQALAFTSFFTVDLLLVKHYFPPFEAGLYAALATLGKIIYFAVSPVGAVMFPIISGRRSRGESYRTIFFISFSITIAVSLLLLVFYWLFPNLAIGTLYGSKYLAGSKELVWMGMFITLYALAQLVVNFLLSLGKTHIVIVPAIVAILQVFAIIRWHSSILEVIQVSMVSMVVLFSLLLSYLGYNQYRIYVKTL